jgi:hypothetical protein
MLGQIAQETGNTPTQLASNWCLCHAPVSVIPKANSIEHTRENCGASGWRLAPAQFKSLSERIGAGGGVRLNGLRAVPQGAYSSTLGGIWQCPNRGDVKLTWQHAGWISRGAGDGGGLMYDRGKVGRCRGSSG